MMEAFKGRTECRWYKEEMRIMEQEELSMVGERKAGFKKQCRLDGKTLLLKVAHTWVIQHVAIQPILAWRFQPSCLAFTVMGGAMQVIRGALAQLWTLWGTIITGLTIYDHWCNSDTDVIGVTKNFLVRFQANSTGWSSYPELLTRPRIGDWVGHRP